MSNQAAAAAQAGAHGADAASQALAAEHQRTAGRGQGGGSDLMEKWLGPGYGAKFERLEHSLRFTPNKLDCVINPASTALKEGTAILSGKTQQEKDQAQSIVNEMTVFDRKQQAAKEVLKKADATEEQKAQANATLKENPPHASDSVSDARGTLKAQLVTEDQRSKTADFLKALIDTKGVRNHQKWYDVFLKAQLLTNPAAVLLGGIFRLLFTYAWPARRASKILEEIQNLADDGPKLTTEQVEQRVQDLEADIVSDSAESTPQRPITLSAQSAGDVCSQNLSSAGDDSESLSSTDSDTAFVDTASVDTDFDVSSVCSESAPLLGSRPPHVIHRDSTSEAQGGVELTSHRSSGDHSPSV